MTTTRRNDLDAAPCNGRAMEGRSSSLVTTTRTSMNRHQVDAIRRRICDGDYDTPQAVDAVARRILESGDL